MLTCSRDGKQWQDKEEPELCPGGRQKGLWQPHLHPSTPCKRKQRPPSQTGASIMCSRSHTIPVPLTLFTLHIYCGQMGAVTLGWEYGR